MKLLVQVQVHTGVVVVEVLQQLLLEVLEHSVLAPEEVLILSQVELAELVLFT